MARERYVVGLDVGTSKVAAIVGEMMDEGRLDIIGIGLADAKGIRRGVVNNVDSAAESIKRALDEAELTAGVEIDTVHLALSGAHVKAFNSRGVVAVAGRSREISRDDVKRAIDAARAVALPSGREILHVLPQDFVVDGLVRMPARGAPAADPVRALLVERVFEDLRARPDLRQRVSQIDVSDARDVVVLLDTDATLVHLGDGRFVERLKTYVELGPALQERLRDIDYVDMRYDERVYVRSGTPEAQKSTVKGRK